MKKLVFAVVVALAFAGVAEDKAPAPKDAAKPELTEAEKAANKQRMLERTGGIVERVGTGKAVIVNCQKKIPVDAINEKVAQMRQSLRVKIEVEDGAWKMGDALPNGANTALYVVDDAALPMSLVAPEAHWGVLNVNKIDAGARFNKALVRASIFTFGSAVSQFKGSPMQTISTPDDLDGILSESLTFDAVAMMINNLKGIGVTQSRKATYRKACKDGWAAAPTNDYQKAIWDEIHALPDKPLTIKKQK